MYKVINEIQEYACEKLTPLRRFRVQTKCLFVCSFCSCYNKEQALELVQVLVYTLVQKIVLNDKEMHFIEDHLSTDHIIGITNL